MFRNFVWIFCLKVSFGNFIWMFCLKVSVRNFVWKFCYIRLDILFGSFVWKFVWKYLLEVSFGNFVWKFRLDIKDSINCQAQPKPQPNPVWDIFLNNPATHPTTRHTRKVISRPRMTLTSKAKLFVSMVRP